MDTPKTVKDMFPSRFITAPDLRGSAHTLTIESITIETMRDRFTNHDMQKPVMRFVGAKKAMTLNKTQCYRLAEILHTEVFDEWVGKTIQIKPAVFRGKDTIHIDPAPKPIEE